MALRDRGGVANRVRQLREALRLSQTAFAARVDSTQPTVSDWERAKTTPDRGQLRLIADLVKDDRRVFRWLEQGGVTPDLIAFDSVEPGAIDRLHAQAVVELSAASRAIDGDQWTPLPLVVRWLGRISDALGWAPTRSDGGTDAGARVAGR